MLMTGKVEDHEIRPAAHRIERRTRFAQWVVKERSRAGRHMRARRVADHADAVRVEPEFHCARTQYSHRPEHILQWRRRAVVLVAVDEHEDRHAVIRQPLGEGSAAHRHMHIAAARRKNDGRAICRAGLGRKVKQLRVVRVGVGAVALSLVRSVRLDARHAFGPQWDFLGDVRRVQHWQQQGGEKQEVGEEAGCFHG